MNSEKISPISQLTNIPIIKEKTLFNNNCLLLFTDNCPTLISSQIQSLVKNSGTSWISSSTTELEFIQSRRAIYFPQITDIDNNYPIFKRKKQNNAAFFEGMKVKYFTNSLIHEIRTSYYLSNIISLKGQELPTKIPYRGVEYSLTYSAQEPWGILIDLKNSIERFGIFKRAPGISVRDHVASVGGWNYLEQEDRYFFAQIHNSLNVLTSMAVPLGLEPWDLGVHQIMYDIDNVSNKIELTILDTEEYNLSNSYGSYYTQAMVDSGLPPVIMFL